MKVVEALNTAVDTNTADDIMSVYRSSVKKVLIAPYKCMVFAITSCLLLGTKYTKFVLVSTVMCLLYSGVSTVLFLTSWDFEFLGYVAGGLLTILISVTVLRKDSGHISLLKEAEMLGREQESVGVTPVRVPVKIEVPTVEELRAKWEHKPKKEAPSKRVATADVEEVVTGVEEQTIGMQMRMTQQQVAQSVQSVMQPAVKEVSHVKAFLDEIDLDELDLDDLDLDDM